MKKFVFTLSCLLALSPLVLKAQTGAPYIHDPSTLAECDGKYYTFGTGGGGLISRGAAPHQRPALGDPGAVGGNGGQPRLPEKPQ